MHQLSERSERQGVIHVVPHQRSAPRLLEFMAVAPQGVRALQRLVHEEMWRTVLGDERFPGHWKAEPAEPVIDLKPFPHLQSGGQYFEAHPRRRDTRKVLRIFENPE